ncbi:MAG TPA: MOP flippase family protein [Candidatus Bathyarchaeia archaeon]|nr:MOP flippase family protein [Candidatus Bathyarchaeia archaeon]
MSLKQATISGLKWTSAASAGVAALNFLKTVVVARILSPGDFGRAAIAIALLDVLRVFSDAGVGAAIVQRASVTARQLTAIFWVTVAISMLLSGAFIAGIPMLDAFYRAPALSPLFIATATVLPLGAVGTIHVLLLQRRLAFGALALADVASALLNGVVAVWGALAGYGALAIVLGLVAGTGLRSVIVIAADWKEFLPLHRCRISDVRSFVGFGLFQMGDRLVRAFATRIDQILIGRFLGVTDLGYYSLAYNLAIQPIARAALILNRVTLPVFAKMQSEIPRLRRAFGQVLTLLSALVVPAMLFLVFFALPAIVTLYGPKWRPAAPLLQLLSLAAVFWTVDYPTTTLQVAMGQAGRSFMWSLIILGLTAAGVVAGAQISISGVAAGLLASWAVVFVLEYFFILRPLVGTEWRGYFWEALGAAAFNAAVAGAVALWAVRAIAAGNVTRLALGAAGFVFLYGVTLWFGRRGVAQELVAAVRRPRQAPA